MTQTSDTETGDPSTAVGERPGFSGTDSFDRYRAEYGLLRGFFKHRSERFEEFQEYLVYANINQTYDEYLTTAVRRSLFVGLFLAVLQVVVYLGDGLGILSIGAFPLVSTLVTVLLWLVVTVLGVGIAAGYYLYLPAVRARLRERRIEPVLPHAVVFMYALSEGGLDLMTIMERLADATEEYGEVAAEFEAITTDIRRFNVDPLTAIDDAKRRTPSDDLQEFLDDMMSVIQSGGDINTFLRNRSERQLQESRERQENFLDTLAALVEGYITVVFAGPIFIIVVLVIMSFTGTGTLLATNVLIYGLIPLGIGGFIALVHFLQTRYEPDVDLHVPRGRVSEEDVAEDQRTAYLRAKRATTLRQFLDEPIETMRRRPALSLFFTVPVAGLFWVSLVVAGVATPSTSGYSDSPITTTTALVVLPLYIPAIGLMAAYETKRQRTANVKKRFPGVLEGLGSANKNGVRFVECVTLVSRQSEGRLADYLRKLDTDIRVTGDVYNSLRRFAIEVDVPLVSRVTKIIIEAHKSSRALHPVLEITAKDAAGRARLELERTRAIYPYLVFFILGVLVFLVIALLLTEILFPAVGELGDAEVGLEQLQPGEGEIPLDQFEVALYHALLIQAFGNGLVIGKLIDDDLTSGLKYALPLVLVVVLGFHIV